MLGWLLPSREKALAPVSDHRRGWYTILESYAGAWQQNVEVDLNTVLSQHAVFACMTLLARDIAKLRMMLVAKNSDGIWQETTNPAYSPVLRKPNEYQTRIQFFEHWALSKLARGNTYVLKRRDNRNVVTALYILDPNRVTPLISEPEPGTRRVDVFYQLSADNMSGIGEGNIVVPASEIIHDRFNCLFHPMVGLSPIFANGLAATHGINIQKDGVWFFGNRSTPGGVLTAPGAISQETAERLKATWETNFAGESSGKIAVLGDGLRFEQMRISAADSQVIEQLKWSAETVCSTFHVPPYKIGVGQMPSYNNIQALNLEYYQQGLQSLIEDIELCLDEGLGIGEAMGIGTQFDTDGLLRMDAKTQMEVLEAGKSVMTLDERRRKLDLPKITGGGTVYLQQQDHSIEAIAARDKLLIEQAENPAMLNPPPPALPAPDAEMERDALAYRIRRRLEERLNAP